MPATTALVCGDPLNAAAALIDIELASPARGDARIDTAVFCDDDDSPLTAGVADRIFNDLARYSLGETTAASLSLHGGRIFLAVVGQERTRVGTRVERPTRATV